MRQCSPEPGRDPPYRRGLEPGYQGEGIPEGRCWEEECPETRECRECLVPRCRMRGCRCLRCREPECRYRKGTGRGCREEGCPEFREQTGMRAGMRRRMRWRAWLRGCVWLAHVYWNRMYLMSVTADAPDQQAVEERALQTADEITDVFAEYFPISVVRQLRNLLITHVELTGELIRSLKSGDTENRDNLIREWYGNANQIAALLGGQNPFFGSRETRNLLLNHLDLVREEIEQQVDGEYGESIETFRDVVNQALDMADYFARGLLAR